MPTRISAGVGDPRCFLFITVIPINCKITHFPLYLLYIISRSSKTSSDDSLLQHTGKSH